MLSVLEVTQHHQHVSYVPGGESTRDARHGQAAQFDGETVRTDKEVVRPEVSDQDVLRMNAG